MTAVIPRPISVSAIGGPMERQSAWRQPRKPGGTVVGIGAKAEVEPATFGRFLEGYEQWKERARADTWPERLTRPSSGRATAPRRRAAPAPNDNAEKIRDALTGPRRSDDPLDQAT